VATIEELVIAHPDLLTSQHPMGQLRIHLGAIAEDQQRWKEKLARGLPGTLKRGEFRRDGSWYGRTGQLWHTQRKANAGEERVPAEKYTEHPNSGGLRRTREAGSLPSLRRSSEPCVVTTKEPQPEVTLKRASINRRLAH
jgi:hypothetical protein